MRPRRQLPRVVVLEDQSLGRKVEDLHVTDRVIQRLLYVEEKRGQLFRIGNFENYACAVPRGARSRRLNQIELAAGASVSKNVIVDFEKGRSNPTKNNMAAIQRVLEEAGVEFANGDAPGVRLRKKKR